MSEETLFELACKTPVAERAALLDRACEGKPELRERVEALLRADAGSVPFLAQQSLLDPTIGHQATASYTSGDMPGVVISGRYKLLEEIGEGGMGTVWMAQQLEPVKRLVAIKLIKMGMDSKAVLARFDAERQALAMMDHPNIAKVLDGGIDNDPLTPGPSPREGEGRKTGRPYFVMELVKGTPITKFCDERKLSLKERLELFVPVCQAIQHAHQKGIIHRDIKPSNVLIALYDDRPVPKVIDFGVAKATGAQLTEQTLNTGFGAIVGTPEYMSPEQASLNNLDIDTRSDVYALGVLLYELLTGTTPVDKKSLGKAAMLEILRIVREVEAPRPSTKLSSSEALPTIASNRHTEPAKLSKMMKGELDWIVMKALEKDRTRRYETANGFAADVLRYLSGEAVVAYPPSMGYRLKKLLKRNKGQVIAAGLVFLTLIGGIVGTTWGLYWALISEADARKNYESAELAGKSEAKQRLLAEENEKIAKRQLAIAQTLSEFLQRDVLGQAGSWAQAFSKHNPNPKLTVLEAVDRAAQTVSERFKQRPELEASIRHTLGNAYCELGMFSKAINQLQTAVKLRKELLGYDHADTSQSMSSLAFALTRDGQVEQAKPLLEAVYTNQKNTLGPDHRETIRTMIYLANQAFASGDREGAISIYQQALTQAKKTLGEGDECKFVIMNGLAEVLQSKGEYDKAIKIMEEVLEKRSTDNNADRFNTISFMSNLAALYREKGEFEKAFLLWEKGLEQEKLLLGQNHPDTLNSMNNLAAACYEKGKIDKAILIWEEVLEKQKSILGQNHPQTLVSMSNLAMAYLKGSQPTRAIPIMESALAKYTAKFGADHPDTLTYMNNLAQAYSTMGEKSKALSLYEQTFDKTTIKLGPDHPKTLTCMANLALAYRDTEQSDKAIPLLEKAMEKQKTLLGPDHPSTLLTMGNLALSYKATGKLDKATTLLILTLGKKQKVLGKDHPDTLNCMHNLALCHYAAKMYDKAIPLWEQAVDMLKTKLGPEHPITLNSMGSLAMAYYANGQLDKAIPLNEVAAQGVEKIPYHHRTSDRVIPNVVFLYETDNQYEKAEQWRRRWLSLVKQRAGPESKDYSSELGSLGWNLQQQQKWSASEAVFRECLDIRSKHDPESWKTPNTMSWLGGSLLAQKKYLEAEPLLLRGYEGLKSRETTIPPEGKLNIAQALDRLIQLYTETNKPEEVKKWQAEKAKLPKLVEQK